ncbi:MAG: YicC family protein [Phycisphaerae bacterium]|nr:YicC family protein [Phycisphaerae bacterium]NIP51649.1 YicC family protein [Phycisphaerae bacterium]NIS50759.1 YicC family protein [Phycisphaerae bacterium]NIU08510.1 YicC family protein [Phycisphaerae bacterium]NIU57792.1 YicC family protein [Phycisphaerae bacterium]
MISSMTGYGDAEGQLNGVTYMVEIRTVNNRYFKANIKLPETIAFLTDAVEKLLRRNLSRGSINYVLRLRNASANVLFDIDEKALQTVMERLGRIASSAKIKCPIDIGNLLNLPGILEPATPDEDTAEKIKKTVLEISQEAIEKLKQMRAAEGTALEADLKKHCDAIKQDIEQISARSEVVLTRYADKLKKRVNELLADAKLKLDEETLAREVAIFAERSDISEEIARLDSHLQQLMQGCQTNSQAGRRLDFISQEMLREANTIASKASDTEITRCVVDIKCRIDRIKEQVQNIE